MKNSFEIADLISRKLNGSISPGQEKLLEEWVKESPENEKVLERATDPSLQLNKLEIYNLFAKDKIWSGIDEKIFPTKTINFSTSRFLSYAAAILLPIMVAGFAWIYLGNKEQTNIATIDTVIKPGSQKAQLILADGATVEFDNDESLADIDQGEAIISNENNSLVYSEKKQALRRKKLIYNELRTPRGGGYNLSLADGSTVYLNAGSTLRFPVSFSDSTRHVYLDGEGYFEVTHNGKPFIVSTGDMDIRVLGTSFNVSAYSDEAEIITTLVEGKVRIDYKRKNKSFAGSEVLTPNKQALLNKYLEKVTIADVNTAHYTSWMQGRLEFSNEPLDIVLKRLARWYDFEYEFENVEARDYHFTARVSNTESISTILGMLEMTTDVKFDFKKNKIVVK